MPEKNGKQMALEILETLPENVTLSAIAEAFQFVDGINEGLEQLDRGEYFTAEDIRARIPIWAGIK